MDPEVTNRDLEGLGPLLAKATEIYRRATNEDEHDPIWDLLRQARAFGREAFDAGVAMVDSGDAAERAVGCHLLGTLCNPDEENWGPSVARVLAQLAKDEQDADVILAIAHALDNARDHRGLATLVRLVGHSDSDIRFQVAVALPACEEGADPDVLASALITLMSDHDDDVRDWATFGLGTQTELDGPEVREALLARLDDECLDAQEEAMVGLARRRDRRALPVVLARLGDEQIGRLAVEAAAYLADESLLARLRGLESWWDCDPELLADAIASCDPARRPLEVAAQAAFMEALEVGLAEMPGVRAWLSCDRFDRGAVLEVEQLGKVGRYGFDSLVMDRAGGDVRVAAVAVLSDIRRERDAQQRPLAAGRDNP